MKQHFEALGRVSVLLKMVMTLLLLALATSAQSRTVRWQEEVPLNTGETITVQRELVYTLRGGWANPMDIERRPQRIQTIKFQWSGKQYRYEGDAAIMLLAISPAGLPVLVARAGDYAWHRVHRYECTVPFYVQLVPDPTGQAWYWPPSVEQWLHGLPANLLLSRPHPSEFKSWYSAEDRAALDRRITARTPSRRLVDPKHTGNCRSMGVKP